MLMQMLMQMLMLIARSLTDNYQDACWSTA